MEIFNTSFKAGLCLAAALAAGTVQAGIIFSPGVTPSAAAVENVRFDPVPEPTTLLSFSLASLALWAVHARRRSARCTGAARPHA